MADPLAIGQAPLILRHLAEEADDALGIARALGINLPNHEDLTREATRTRCAILRGVMDLAGQFYLREILSEVAVRKAEAVGVQGFQLAAPVSVGADLREVGRPALVPAVSQIDLETLCDLAEAAADALGDPEGAAS